MVLSSRFRLRRSASPVRRVAIRRVLVAACLLVGPGSLALMSASAAHADSTKMSGDSSDTSWYANQPLLTPSAVGGGDFGTVFSTTLSGKVYAQPLVDKGTVLTVTESDMVYGIDAQSGVINWSTNYGPAATPASLNGNQCGDIGTSVGITSTPVIDTATDIAYFVAARATGVDGATQYFLEAAHVATGEAPTGWPTGGVLIQGSADNDPSTVFNGEYATQRPGLVLVNGVVYAAFSGQCDMPAPNGLYNGWVVGISTVTDAMTSLWSPTIDGAGGGGIWQSGGAPVVDANGNLYIVTGNATNVAAYPTSSDGTAPLTDYREAVVELSAATGSLQATDWFMPANAQGLDQSDLDFSSGGPVALPASMGTPQEPHVVVAGGKYGTLYVLNADHLGGYQAGANGTDGVPFQLRAGGGIWSKPAVWPGDGGYLYLPVTGTPGSGSGTDNGSFNAYQRIVSASGAVGFALAGSTNGDAAAGSFGFGTGAPIVTSNGTTSGSSLVWVVRMASSSDAAAQLEAFDPIPTNPGANGQLPLVWSSATFAAEKYSQPGVGDGMLYVGTTDGHLLGFGFGSSTPALTGTNIDYPSTTVGDSGTATATFTATSDTTISALSVTGGSFTLDSSGSLPATLVSGQSLAVPVTFTPNELGTSTGTLTATTLTGDIAGTVTVSLAGLGTSSTGPLVASPSSVDFAAQPIGGSAVSSNVVITNTSDQAITITGFESPQEPFVVTNPPSDGTLAPGASLTLNIGYFPPGSSGNFEHVFGGLTVLETSAGNVGIPLSGSADPPAHLALLATGVDGPVSVGSSALLHFEVANTGALPLTITASNHTLSGPFTALTSLAPGVVLAANSSIDETVRFSPTAPGSFATTWTVTGSDGTGAHTLTLNGTGVATVPMAPQSLRVTNALGTVLVHWSPPISDGGSALTGYTVTASRGVDSATCRVAPTVTSCGLRGLALGGRYQVVVVAQNAKGTSPSTPGVSVTPQTTPSAPTVTTWVTRGHTITVRWTGPKSTGGAPLTGYRVTATSSAGTLTCHAGASSLSCVLGTTSAKVLYRVSVVALNSIGSSPPSPWRWARS